MKQNDDVLLHRRITKHSNLMIPFSDHVTAFKFPRKNEQLINTTVTLKYRDRYIADKEAYSISNSKREQKDKLSKYAIVMLKQQVQRSVSLLLNCGIKITDEQLLELVASDNNKEKNKKLVGKDDIKKKFMSVMDEYLENTQNYL